MAPRHRSLHLLAVLGLAVVLGTETLATPLPVSAAQPASMAGFRVLAGRQAADYRLPSDVRLVGSSQISADGLVADRYQQFAAGSGAAVDGAQLTVLRRGATAVLVVGSHEPAARARNRLTLDERRAINRPPAVEDELDRSAELRLDPDSGRLFYRVETRSMDARQFISVDAETGVVFEVVDALAHDHGRGVKGDRKSMVGRAGKADNLTRAAASGWAMRSVDGRLVTYDIGNRWSGALNVPKDSDNHWTAARQRAAVDAQYYARLTDDFYRRRFGFDLLGPNCGYGQIRNVVHFGTGYSNAYWNGWYMVYGDGDGRTFRALSGAQDVVSHELTHAVTECTSMLDYQDQPGALNEAFSDIMATVAEFDAAEPTSSNCRREAGQTACPDWWIGEDAYLGAGALGIRNLARPALGGQPSHYSQRVTGTADNGGVHVNSAIPAHAFYLMAAGGRNARCAGVADAQADCDIFVPPVGLADAARMAFTAYSMLPSNADFCAAAQATTAAAQALFPGSVAHAASVELAWAAVGVGSACGGQPNDFSLRLPAHALALKPGSSGQLAVVLDRVGETGPIDFAITGAPAGWFSLVPATSTGPSVNDGTLVSIAVPAGAADGFYPFEIRATSAGASRHGHALLIVDGTAPQVTVPVVHLASAGSVGPGSGAPLTVTWNASDQASGITQASLEWSIDGGTWQDASPGGVIGGSTGIAAGAGLHRFRVRATDWAGNMATSASSPQVRATEHQESAASYSAGWSAAVQPQGWGSVRYAKAAASRATFRFSGREVAWVATRAPKRGKADVVLDGVVVTRVDLYAASRSERQIVFRATGLSAGPHVLRVVVRGTTGRPRVDVDGFLVLAQ